MFILIFSFEIENKSTLLTFPKSNHNRKRDAFILNAWSVWNCFSASLAWLRWRRKRRDSRPAEGGKAKLRWRWWKWWWRRWWCTYTDKQEATRRAPLCRAAHRSAALPRRAAHRTAPPANLRVPHPRRLWDSNLVLSLEPSPSCVRRIPPRAHRGGASRGESTLLLPQESSTTPLLANFEVSFKPASQDVSEGLWVTTRRHTFPCVFLLIRTKCFESLLVKVALMGPSRSAQVND